LFLNGFEVIKYSLITEKKREKGKGKERGCKKKGAIYVKKSKAVDLISDLCARTQQFPHVIVIP
jgi:hypothetical protein